MSAAVGGIIASVSLLLSPVVTALTLTGNFAMFVMMALFPTLLVMVSLVVFGLVRTFRERKNLPVQPAPIPLVVWSIVGVPVFPGLLVLITALGSGGDEYSLAGAWVLAIFSSGHGLWIAALISSIVAIVMKRREVKLRRG